MTEWFAGPGSPAHVVGHENDFYLDTVDGYVYRRDADKWLKVTRFTGAQGDPGLAGSQILSGDREPLPVYGRDGDLYLVNRVGAIYHKDKGVWGRPKLSLVGPMGPPGKPGATGKPGSQWLAVKGEPKAFAGEAGDWAINEGNGDVFHLVNDQWQRVLNLHGPGGPQGAPGANGVDGRNGVDGATWSSGSGAPPDGMGADHDFYLNTLTGEVWRKNRGTWGPPMATLRGPQGVPGLPGEPGPVGPQGEQGPAGPQGPPAQMANRIHVGPGVPDHGLGGHSDIYLRFTTGELYTKSAVWGEPVGKLAASSAAAFTAPMVTSLAYVREGVLAPANGGTGLSKFGPGELLFAATEGALGTVMANKGKARMFLAQAGDGVKPDSPAWRTLATSDLPAILRPFGTSIIGSAESLALAFGTAVGDPQRTGFYVQNLSGGAHALHTVVDAKSVVIAQPGTVNIMAGLVVDGEAHVKSMRVTGGLRHNGRCGSLALYPAGTHSLGSEDIICVEDAPTTIQLPKLTTENTGRIVLAYRVDGTARPVTFRLDPADHIDGLRDIPDDRVVHIIADAHNHRWVIRH